MRAASNYLDLAQAAAHTQILKIVNIVDIAKAMPNRLQGKSHASLGARHYWLKGVRIFSVSW